MREILIGFDSAWTHSSKNPGALAANMFETSKPAVFHPLDNRNAAPGGFMMEISPALALPAIASASTLLQQTTEAIAVPMKTRLHASVVSPRERSSSNAPARTSWSGMKSIGASVGRGHETALPAPVTP